MPFAARVAGPSTPVSLSFASRLLLAELDRRYGVALAVVQHCGQPDAAEGAKGEQNG
jgi:hypothetical protein